MTGVATIYVRPEVMMTEATNIGERLKLLKPAERLDILHAFHRAARFCWVCGKDYCDPHTYTCHCENDE